MGLFDKIKKILNGETITPPKTIQNKVVSNSTITKPVVNSVLIEEDKNKIRQELKYGQTLSDGTEVQNDYRVVLEENKNADILSNTKSLEQEFLKNESNIFNEVIFANLFSDNNRYSDDGIFAKSEPYLKKYFENLGYDWVINKTEILSLCQRSNKAKIIADYLEGNFSYYISNRMDLKWTGHFPDWLKFVIDRSIWDKKPVTKQYARMIVADYYFKDFSSRGSKDVLYKNIISMISAEEFKTWINNDILCFEKIVQRTKKRFIKVEVADLDERILITQIVKSKLFQQALSEYDFIDGYARKSKYSAIYIEVAQTGTKNNIDLNVKNIVTEESKTKEEIPVKPVERKVVEETPVVKSTRQEEKADVKTTPQSSVKEVISSIETMVETPVQTNAVAETLKDQEKNTPAKRTTRTVDELDKFLKRIGGNRKVENIPTISFLEDIKEELDLIEDIKVFKYEAILSHSDEDLDEEIESIYYF